MQNIKEIKQLSYEERPREKLALEGIKSLSNPDILAVLLGSGTKQMPVMHLSERLIKASGYDLSNLLKMTTADLQVFPGIGPAKASLLQAAFELAIRAKRTRPKLNYMIAIREHFRDFPSALFVLFLFDASEKLLASYELIRGTDGYPDIEAIVAILSDSGAAKIYFAGNCKHDAEDRLHLNYILKKLKGACYTFGIQFHPKLIIT